MRLHALTFTSLLALSTALGACSTLPSSGPSADQVNSGTSDAALAAGYVLLDLTPGVVEAAGRNREPAFGAGLRGGGGSSNPLGVGDTVNITIYEASGEGALFSRPGTAIGGGNFVSIPTQVIDRSGNVSVPYAGSVRAAGRTVGDLQRDIEEKLKNRAIEPQVVVSVPDRRSSLLTVVGDVNQPTRMNVDLAGVRVLDAIAAAGGSRFPAYETQVVLQRRGGGRSQTSLARLIRSENENVTLAPGDTLQLIRQQRFFLAMGASGRSARIEFDSDRLSLADALAKAGGLLDDRANPSGIYLYRQESPKILRDAGVPVTSTSATVPTIYRLNLRDPSGFFLAEGFSIKANDIVYVANAPTVDFLKFMTVVRSVTSVARDVSGVVRDIDLTIGANQGRGETTIIDDVAPAPLP